jgi:hypothetical protein
MFYSQRFWVLVVVGVMLSLAPANWTAAQEIRPDDFYLEQTSAALTGALLFALLPVLNNQQAFGEGQSTLWCERQSIVASSIAIGGGAHVGVYLWSRLARQIWGSGGVSLAMAVGGASMAAFYTCRAAPSSPWLVLAAQIVAASLLAPLGYNMDALILPEER